GVADVEAPRDTAGGLLDVPLDDTGHLVTLNRVHPPLGLVPDHERWPVPLHRVRGRGHGLDPATIGGVDDRFVDLQAVLLLQVLGDHHREQGHRVLGLLLGHGRELNPGRVAAFPNRLTVLVEPVERDRPAQLGERNRSRQRVLAPPLHPAENAGPVDETALLVDGVPPEQEPRLLISRDEPLTGEFAAGGSNVLEQPSENTPPQGAIGQIPFAVRGLTPGRTDDVRRRRKEPVLHNSTYPLHVPPQITHGRPQFLQVIRICSQTRRYCPRNDRWTGRFPRRT